MKRGTTHEQKRDSLSEGVGEMEYSHNLIKGHVHAEARGEITHVRCVKYCLRSGIN